MSTQQATTVTEQVRAQQGDYLVAVETLEESHAELLEAFNLAHTFLDSLPEGWLGKTGGDVAALNEFYLLSRKIRART